MNLERAEEKVRNDRKGGSDGLNGIRVAKSNLISFLPPEKIEREREGESDREKGTLWKRGNQKSRPRGFV